MQNSLRTLWAILAFLSVHNVCAVAAASAPQREPGSQPHVQSAVNSTVSPGQAKGAVISLQPASPAAQPVRARRPYKVASSVGYNGLAGVGIQLSYHPNPYFALEFGLGLAGRAMPKAGTRLRLNFSTHDFSPFVGVGTTHVFAPPTHKMHFSVHGKDAGATHEPETMAHLILGVSDSWSNGLTLEAGVGYARALSQTHHGQEFAHAGTNKLPLTGRSGGPLMEISVGYSF